MRWSFADTLQRVGLPHRPREPSGLHPGCLQAPQTRREADTLSTAHPPSAVLPLGATSARGTRSVSQVMGNRPPTAPTPRRRRCHELGTGPDRCKQTAYTCPPAFARGQRQLGIRSQKRRKGEEIKSAQGVQCWMGQMAAETTAGSRACEPSVSGCSRRSCKAWASLAQPEASADGQPSSSSLCCLPPAGQEGWVTGSPSSACRPAPRAT